MSHSSATIRLVVNADDFGYSRGVSEGILKAHRDGIVTATSLMPLRSDAVAAVRHAESHPSLDIGLHVDTGEWIYRGGQWRPLYVIVDPDAAESTVRDEFRRQLDAFQRLVGREPTHLDSHQHVHRSCATLAEVMMAAAQELHIPLRHMTPSIRYEGGFFGQQARGEPYPQGITVENLVAMIRGLPPGLTEISCHPAAATDHESPYGEERTVELDTLTNPSVAEALADHQVTLLGFKQAMRHRQS
jgi:predicted glycoside hydrolase/deacetylase ChbG (UPF0249 family)